MLLEFHTFINYIMKLFLLSLRRFFISTPVDIQIKLDNELQRIFEYQANLRECNVNEISITRDSGYFNLYVRGKFVASSVHLKFFTFTPKPNL